MQQLHNDIFYSASDIVNFLDCEHHTPLDLIDLETLLPRTMVSEEIRLIQLKGDAHEARYMEKLSKERSSFEDITRCAEGLTSRFHATIEAMKDGVEVIYQPVLMDDKLYGYADFLIKTDTPSSFGDYSYEMIDTKLARSTRARFVIQLALYTFLHSKKP